LLKLDERLDERHDSVYTHHPSLVVSARVPKQRGIPEDGNNLPAVTGSRQIYWWQNKRDQRSHLLSN